MLDDKTAFDTRELTATYLQFASLTMCPSFKQFVMPKDFLEAEQAEIPLEHLVIDISHQTRERFSCIKGQINEIQKLNTIIFLQNDWAQRHSKHINISKIGDCTKYYNFFMCHL